MVVHDSVLSTRRALRSLDVRPNARALTRFLVPGCHRNTTKTPWLGRGQLCLAPPFPLVS